MVMEIRFLAPIRVSDQFDHLGAGYSAKNTEMCQLLRLIQWRLQVVYECHFVLRVVEARSYARENTGNQYQSCTVHISFCKWQRCVPTTVKTLATEPARFL